MSFTYPVRECKRNQEDANATKRRDKRNQDCQTGLQQKYAMAFGSDQEVAERRLFARLVALSHHDTIKRKGHYNIVYKTRFVQLLL
jgi:hypothetical protein